MATRMGIFDYRIGNLQDEIADLNLITAAVVPWDSMVASSLQLAFRKN